MSRLRSMGAFAPGPSMTGSQRYGTCALTTWVPFFTASPCYVGLQKTMEDVVTPQFSKRRAKGEVFFNPLKVVETESSIESSGTLVYHGVAISCAGTGTHHEVSIPGPFSIFHLMNGVYTVPIPPQLIIPSQDISDLTDEVATKGMAERGKAQNNLFESVAEYKQTLKLLAGPIKTIWRFITKNEDKIKVLRPDEAWLIYRYGVLPFIKDVTGIVNGLKQKTGHKRQTTRAKGEISQSKIFSLSISPGAGSLTTFDVQTSDYCKVRYTSIDEYIATKASNIGFTAKGLITVPWELIPYSFVADWFFNVGDYLNAISPAPEYEQKGSCIVIERGTYTRYQNTGMVIANYVVDSIDGAVFHGSVRSKTRKSVGSPRILVKTDFRLDTLVRASDALALISQKLFSLFGSR